jgi:hypothetical protein
MSNLTLKDLNSQIEASNQEFNTASIYTKRVMVAQDVLDRIQIKQIKARRGSVVHVPDTVRTKLQHSTFSFTSNHSIKDTLCNEEFECEVCAKGAMFMGYVGRVNEFAWGLTNSLSAHHHHSVMMKKLVELFTEYQMSLMETAFEGRCYVYGDKDGNSLFPEGTAQHNEYLAALYVYDGQPSHERLIAICNNIIRNEGEFIPSQDIQS